VPEFAIVCQIQALIFSSDGTKFTRILDYWFSKAFLYYLAVPLYTAAIDLIRRIHDWKKAIAIFVWPDSLRICRGYSNRNGLAGLCHIGRGLGLAIPGCRCDFLPVWHGFQLHLWAPFRFSRRASSQADRGGSCCLVERNWVSASYGCAIFDG
jgi:hypothetical protein